LGFWVESPLEWRRFGMADLRNGGPSEWRPFGMADPNLRDTRVTVNCEKLKASIERGFWVIPNF